MGIIAAAAVAVIAEAAVVVERLLVVALLLALSTGAALAEQKVFGPKDKWCAAFKDARPGDEILLRKGIYLKPCTIRARGTADKPITLRSENPESGHRAVIAYGGKTSNVLDIRESEHLIIQDLDITARSKNAEGIKVYDANDITIQRCRMHRLSGVSIAANSANTERLTIRDNEFKNLRATAIYVGCHDGMHCIARDVLIENNLISGAMPRDDRIGYGIQVKLNSNAVIRDNSVYDTKGPGIIVYGNANPEGPASLIEGNYVQRSAWDGGIVAAGGPVLVRNNIAINNGLSGIVAQDYHNRGLQHGVKLVHNTLVNNLRGGIRVEHWRFDEGNVIANNLIVGTPDQIPIKPAKPDGHVLGNADCPSASTCLLAATKPPFDFRLQPTSELRGSVEMGDEDWWPKDDFLGLKREAKTSPGAFGKRYPANLDDALIGDHEPRPARVDANFRE